MTSFVALDSWRLSIQGLVKNNIELSFSDILSPAKVEGANTLECSANGLSLLQVKAPGNTWTIGGVGIAIWKGGRLSLVLKMAGITPEARHVSHEENYIGAFKKVTQPIRGFDRWSIQIKRLFFR